MSSQPTTAAPLAEALGLEGEGALDFVYKQLEFYRNERAAECTARAEEAERVARKREIEIEREV